MPLGDGGSHRDPRPRDESPRRASAKYPYLFDGLGEEKSETVPIVQAEYTGEHIADETESGSMNTHRDRGKLARG